MPQNGKQLPPPIDPGVLRSVTNIRRLIDYATDLSVRASSGISPVELSSMRNNTSYNGTSLAAAQSLGLNPLGTNNIGGRNTSMSANRVHRLRALAVQKLARAYMEDEIASSVMVMQGGSVFDDVAERVLKHGTVPLLALIYALMSTQILIMRMQNMCISFMRRFLPGMYYLHFVYMSFELSLQSSAVSRIYFYHCFG